MVNSKNHYPIKSPKYELPYLFLQATKGKAPMWNFDNSYKSVPNKLFQEQLPVAVSNPGIVYFNKDLAASLGLDVSKLTADELAALLSGNETPEGASPIAQAYAGHQFGHFNILGDGRAILLGEIITTEKRRYDMQLKGAGQTPYSRRGDGRATLKSMLREYIISEALYHLGIKTTRSLAVVATGDQVYRERPNDGAVLTRIAESHIRVGTFEYIRQFLPKEDMLWFTEYVIERHYPELIDAPNPGLALLERVMEVQVDLIVDWLRVGFIHGVMNTDNMSIPGETIDYGPCAFMNAYHPGTVFSSIDTQGRYAFANQPGIAHWNLSILGGTLLPIIADDEEAAVKLAQPVINKFSGLFQEKWLGMMGKKLGFATATMDDKPLIDELLAWIEKHKADYTNTFWLLTTEECFNKAMYNDPSFIAWHANWKNRLTSAGQTNEQIQSIMRKSNPAYIPRNYLVEQALDAAADRGDYALLDNLMKVLSAPYEFRKEHSQFQEVPENSDINYQTFCGT